MNRLNQTEPATFSILPRWLSLGILISLYFILLIEDMIVDRLKENKNRLDLCDQQI
jgi:hypothetical protein